jgi:MoxR-like ATPase
MDLTTRQDSDTAQLMEQILYEVKRVVVGQDRFLERVMVAILAQGHLLVEGVPGLAKTLTVKTLASTITGQFKRIQFTPDLVPSDLVGTRIYNQKTGDFSTALGPVFTNLLLADEINRAPAKVQSALLEVMQERQVTIAGPRAADKFLRSRSGFASPSPGKDWAPCGFLRLWSPGAPASLPAARFAPWPGPG